MIARNSPLPLIVFHVISTIAAPPLRLPTFNTPTPPSLSLTGAASENVNTTKLTVLPHELTSFPPGPPPNPLFHPIPDSDVILELSPLGQIPGRDENTVEKVLSEATRASLTPYRPQVEMSEAGYQLQEKKFLLGVTPSARSPGEEPLTWGRWTAALSGFHGYVEAYPGYDFSFELWVVPEIGASEGYVVGAGFAITRGRRQQK